MFVFRLCKSCLNTSQRLTADLKTDRYMAHSLHFTNVFIMGIAQVSISDGLCRRACICGEYLSTFYVYLSNRLVRTTYNVRVFIDFSWLQHFHETSKGARCAHGEHVDVRYSVNL